MTTGSGIVRSFYHSWFRKALLSQYSTVHKPAIMKKKIKIIIKEKKIEKERPVEEHC